MIGKFAWISLALAALQCAPAEPREAQGPVLRLGEHFDADQVEGGMAAAEPPEPILWRFDDIPEPTDASAEGEDGTEGDEDGTEGTEGDEGDEGGEGEDDDEDIDLTATNQFEAFHDVEDLRVEDDLLMGTTGEIPVLRLAVEPLDRTDVLHEVRLRLRVSEGTKLGLYFSRTEELDREEEIEDLRRSNFWMHAADLEPGDEVRAVTVDLTHGPAVRVDKVRHVFIQPTDASGATFAIEELRFVTRAEHLAGVPSGVSWQGLGEIYRETLVLRAPQRARFDVRLPARPWLDLAVGTIEPQPVTLRVTATRPGGEELSLLRRTITTPERWEEVPLDLSALAGQSVSLAFAVESEVPGTLGFFGTPVVRSAGAAPVAGDGAPGEGPRGVILVLADTLRRDHLDMYGYERPTAPTLSRLAGEGALFTDNISQGTWTKVSVPSILTSLYPTSHGLVDAPDRLPSSVTTLAEAFQQAGYATFATSSVFFSGKLSNLQQGLDVLNERSSVGELEHSRSKTARTFVDRLTHWIEERRDGPFFAFLHVFDPHDPFPPYEPYDSIWSAEDAAETHEEAVETVTEWQEENDKEEQDMPRRSDLEEAGVSPEEFVAREIDWYDESIRGMDQEIARLIERLEELDLADDVVIAFISDHGEEFLEHGRHFHGNTTYGEMTNVPLFLWGPGWVPPGTVVEETVQSLDLMPTLLELAGLPQPEQVQGQSLVPLLGGEGRWTPRPAISERRRPNFRREPEPDDVESFSVVHQGYRLVHNVTRPEGRAEFELYDHRADPLNLEDIAPDHPDLVAELSGMLETWRRWAEASRLDGEDASELTPAELEELRALGYVR